MITVAILTISDAVSQGTRYDSSGENIEQNILGLPAKVVARVVVPDEREQIVEKLKNWSDIQKIDLILTTGGTGLGPRDVTPEATRDVIRREVPGLGELMRLQSFNKNPHAVLSRAVVGTREATLIVNLPGNPKAVVELLDVIKPILPHAIDINKGNHGDHTPPNKRP